jgi:hypothetical protein
LTYARAVSRRSELSRSLASIGGVRFGIRTLRPVPVRRNARRVSRWTASGVAALCLLASTAFAAKSAHELLTESEAKNGLATWNDRTAEARIESHAPGGATRTRTLELVESNEDDGAHRTRMIYRSPADSSGAVFLRTSTATGNPEEWVWTPQSRRARQLASDQADESGYGPELSYRDYEQLLRVLQWSEDESTATLAGEEAVDGGTAAIVEVVPRADDERFARYRLWLEPGSLRIVRAEMIDDDGTVRRRLNLRAYRVDGDRATPTEIEIVRLPAGDKSVIQLEEVRYDTGVPEKAFSLNRLMRGE